MCVFVAGKAGAGSGVTMKGTQCKPFLTVVSSTVISELDSTITALLFQKIMWKSPVAVMDLTDKRLVVRFGTKSVSFSTNIFLCWLFVVGRISAAPTAVAVRVSTPAAEVIGIG